MEIKTAEDNYIFNTKKQIPQGKAIGFIDGNPDNIAFKNLKLVDAPVKKEDPKGKTFEEMSKKELTEVANEMEIDIAEAKTKADIIALINGKLAGEDSENNNNETNE